MRPDLTRFLARWVTGLRRVSGMPDYAVYVAHQRRHHPDQPVPSERDYFTAFVHARYGDGPTRCC